ncbi:MAG: helix-turn-helix domain-containing protein [Candidatus Pacearchaeota archaeon]
MTEKYLLFSLEDEKAKKLGEVVSSKTCKKIVNLLAEKEASEQGIARELKIPISTVEYNLKKLLDAGIIEKSKNFFYSIKGKKIDMYKVVNKLIVIAPKKTSIYSKIKNIVPATIISAALTVFLALYYKSRSFAQQIAMEKATALNGTQAVVASQAFSQWLWFALGCAIAIIVLVAWNWKRL